MPTVGFTDNDGVDVGNKYLTKDYAITNYPGLFANVSSAGLWTWGGNGVFASIAGNSSPVFTGNVSQLATPAMGWRIVNEGGSASAGVKADNTLWTWSVSTASSWMLGQGTVAAISAPNSTIGAGTNWATVSVGATNMLAIKTDGSLWSWGSNQYGQLGTLSATNVSRSSPNTANVAQTWLQISANGSNQLAAIKTDGTLWVWGRNADTGGSGTLGDGTTVAKSSPQTIAGAGTNWKQVSITSAGGAAVKTDGTLWTWGSNSGGRLGDASFTVGGVTYRSSPSTVSGAGTTWKFVACSGGVASTSNTYAVKTDGTLWAWGANGVGQLGDGTTTGRSSPVSVVSGGTSWKTVAANSSNTVAALKTDGTLWTWGSGSSGFLGHGSTNISRSSPGTTLLGSNYWKFISVNNNSMYGIVEADDF